VLHVHIILYLFTKNSNFKPKW